MPYFITFLAMKTIKQFFTNERISWKEMIFYTAILIGIAVYFFAFSSSESSTPLVKKEKTYDTIQPKISKNFSMQKLIGKVSSNNFAMIHPRREGIIKDILVDVGDTVKAGQAIAYLFPPGVEGEGASRIEKARAQLSSAEESLRNVSGGERAEIVQHYEEAETVAFQAVRNIEWLLFGEKNVSRTVNSLVGSFSNQLQENKVFDLFEETERARDDYSVLGEKEKQRKLYHFLDQIEVLLEETEILYRDASEGGNHSEGIIEKHTKEIQALQTKILEARALIDDTLLEVGALEAGVEAAKAAYQNVLVRSGHVKIVSPFSGEISAKFVEVGHMVHPSMALFEVLDVDTTLGEKAAQEVEFGVPEILLASLKIGDSVEISFPMQEHRSFSAKISRKSTQIDRASRTAMMHAALDTETILSHNSDVYVHIQDTKNPIYEIPSYSIKKRRNQNFVFIKKEDGYTKEEVQILAEDGEYSDVTGSITLDSHIVANPSVTLFRQAKDDKPIN